MSVFDDSTHPEEIHNPLLDFGPFSMCLFIELPVTGVLEQDAHHVHRVLVVRDHLVHEGHGVAGVTSLASCATG